MFTRCHARGIKPAGEPEIPTYDWRCAKCAEPFTLFMSISSYIHDKPAPVHCGALMVRELAVVPGLATSNALAGERHYDGMRAQDGSDISSRAKHRAYMKAHNVTTVDDFKDTWKKAADQRAATLSGNDASRVADIAQAVAKLER